MENLKKREVEAHAPSPALRAGPARWLCPVCPRRALRRALPGALKRGDTMVKVGSGVQLGLIDSQMITGLMPAVSILALRSILPGIDRVNFLLSPPRGPIGMWTA